GFRERLQKSGRNGGGWLGQRILVQHLGIRNHSRVRTIGGGRIFSARNDPRGHRKRSEGLSQSRTGVNPTRLFGGYGCVGRKPSGRCESLIWKRRDARE